MCFICDLTEKQRQEVFENGIKMGVASKKLGEDGAIEFCWQSSDLLYPNDEGMQVLCFRLANFGFFGLHKKHSRDDLIEHVRSTLQEQASLMKLQEIWKRLNNES